MARYSHEEELAMRTLIVILATAALAGCTFKSTTVRQAETPPRVVYAQPAPTVVYQPAPTVVYQQPATVYAAPTKSVAVNYAGLNGFELAAQKADAYCNDHYGSNGVRLIADDRSAGRATFACVE
jgi:hypothetical protein